MSLNREVGAGAVSESLICTAQQSCARGFAECRGGVLVCSWRTGEADIMHICDRASGLSREHVATMARVVALALAAQWSLAQCGGGRPSASLGRRRPRRVGHAMHARKDSRERSDSNGVEGRE